MALKTKNRNKLDVGPAKADVHSDRYDDFDSCYAGTSPLRGLKVTQCNVNQRVNHIQCMECMIVCGLTETGVNLVLMSFYGLLKVSTLFGAVGHLKRLHGNEPGYDGFQVLA